MLFRPQQHQSKSDPVKRVGASAEVTCTGAQGKQSSGLSRLSEGMGFLSRNPNVVSNCYTDSYPEQLGC